MLLATNRLLADWLADATYGVNAKIALLTLDGADSAPADVTVADETRNDQVALGLIPTTLPAVLVSVQEVEYRDPQQPHVTNEVDARVTVLIRYAQRAVVAETGLSDAYYTLQAVMMSLRELHTNEQASGRTRGTAALYECEDIRQVPMTQEIDDAWVTGAIRATYMIRDTAPRG